MKITLIKMALQRNLIIMSSPMNQIVPKFKNYMSNFDDKPSSTLYIHLTNENKHGLSKIMTNLYQIQCHSMDLRLLLTTNANHLQPLDQVYFEAEMNENDKNSILNQLKFKGVQELPKIQLEENEPNFKEEYQSHDFVCLGGTFDRLHEGHKILLSEAALRCDKVITVGVTDENMLKSKKVADLIQDTEVRIQNVKDFLFDIRGHDKDFITAISDPFGPAIKDESLTCIVGSQETKRGCEKINEIRKDKKFSELEIILINLVDDTCHEVSMVEETKISSSNKRIRLLGEQLKEPLKDVSLPYIIGLTGGSASGKSRIASYLQDLGAGIVDCDGLGHKAYEPGTDCYNQILETFGQDLKNPETEKIDRRKLGAKVFSNPDLLHKLESIVWPEILKQAKHQIEEFHQKGVKIVILDAAVLLQVTRNLSFRICQIKMFLDRLDGIKKFTKCGEHSLTKMKQSKGLLNEMEKVQRKLKQG